MAEERICAIPHHRRTFKIYSPAENKYIIRGRCQDHLKNGVVTYSGNYKHTGEPLRITHYKLNKNLFVPKCTLKCRSGRKSECLSQNPLDVTDAIREQINFLSNKKNENLLGYRCVIIDNLDIYLVQEVEKRSTSASSVNRTIRWTYEAIGNATTSIVKAIHYLHQNDVPHGHLKTSSFFVNDQNVWKVADFFMVAYFHYLSNKTNTDCFAPNRKNDLKSIARLVESLDTQLQPLHQFVRLCKASFDIEPIISHPLFEKISKFSRLEAEYEIDSYLGEGAFGDVLKVIGYTDKKEYAIKRVKLPSKTAREFNQAKKEAESLSKLKHTNIVQYHTSWTETVDGSVFNSYKSSNGNDMDVEMQPYSNEDNSSMNSKCQTVGVLYILMELCDIKNLSSVIDEGNLRGNAERLYRYSKQILEALCYTHAQKLIHSDLKPDNILFKDDQIKISDYGLTSTTRSILQRYRNHDESLIHIPPELMNNNTRSRNVDMFQFGIVLFEMCFGPFQNFRERSEILKMIQNDDHIPERYIHHSTYHVFIEIMRALLNENARERPTAKDTLKIFEQLNWQEW